MTPSKSSLAGSFVVAGLLFLAACTHHQIEIQPVEINPIDIMIDNDVKVDKALDDFFGDLDNAKKQ